MSMLAGGRITFGNTERIIHQLTPGYQMSAAERRVHERTAGLLQALNERRDH